MTWLTRRAHRGDVVGHVLSDEPDGCDPGDLPVQEPEAIGKLADELATPADALRYRDHFARLLPDRIEQVSAGVASRDRELTFATLLSLKVGSSMLGAARLQHVVCRCLEDIDRGCKVHCLSTLQREAEQFLAHLADEQRGRTA